jgi:hypothetical protein
MFKTKLFTLLLALSAATLPIGVNAQQTSSPETPSYSRPAIVNGDETIKGRVLSYDGRYQLQVTDDRGFIDRVQLHQGTIINPTGLRLAPGMSVTISGVNRGSLFAANQIDTPYSSYGDAYDPYAYAYPYPMYGYPYGPRIHVGIGFGGGFYGRGRFR